VEIQKESEGYDIGRGMIISIDTVTQVSIEVREKKKVNKNIGINVEHNTNNTHEYDDTCVRIWKRREMRMYVWIHVRRN
jgi:hypothetical protein